MVGVDGHVQGGDAQRVELACVLQRAQGGLVEVLDQHHHLVAGLGRGQALGGLHLELGQLAAVGLLDAEQQPDEQRDGDHHHPGALGELAHDDHHQGDHGHDGPDPVDQDAPARAGLAQAQVPVGHARLGQGEGGHHPDGVQRDQRVDVGLEEHDQEDGHRRQGDDAVGVDETVAPLAELPGQQGVAGGEACQQREPGEGGVGRQHQDEQGRRLDQEERRPVAKDLPGDLGDDGRVAALERQRIQLHGQVGDAQEQRPHDRRHHHQGPLGVDRLWGPEGRDPVGDGLDAGEGGRARGEGAQEQEHGHGPDGVGVVELRGLLGE